VNQSTSPHRHGMNWPARGTIPLGKRACSERRAEPARRLQCPCAVVPHCTTVLRSPMRSSGSIFPNTRQAIH